MEQPVLNEHSQFIFNSVIVDNLFLSLTKMKDNKYELYYINDAITMGGRLCLAVVLPTCLAPNTSGAL